MAKAIHWPAPFRQEVLGEDTVKLHCALRLGDLYFRHQFWVPGEIVDIRVNHLKVRKATVVGELKLCTPNTLSPEDFQMLKQGLQTPEAVIGYLSKTYDQPVTGETPITVVYYRNHGLVAEEMEIQDDPHMHPTPLS